MAAERDGVQPNPGNWGRHASDALASDGNEKYQSDEVSVKFAGGRIFRDLPPAAAFHLV